MIVLGLDAKTHRRKAALTGRVRDGVADAGIKLAEQAADKTPTDPGAR